MISYDSILSRESHLAAGEHQQMTTEDMHMEKVQTESPHMSYYYCCCTVLLLYCKKSVPLNAIYISKHGKAPT